MKTPEWFKRNDATITKILLAVLVILFSVLFYLVLKNTNLNKHSNEENHQFVNISLRIQCYKIPYTREDLETIEKEDGEELTKLRDMLRKKIASESLGRLAGPPKVEFSEDSTTICLYFSDPSKPKPVLPKTRLL